MAHYQHSIHIDALPQTIWAAWVDIDNWKTWAPTIREGSGEIADEPFAVGKEALLDVRGAGRAVWTITTVEPERRFAWESYHWGVHTKAEHVVEPDGAGSKVTLVLDFSGMMSVLFAPIISRVANGNLAKEAEGLRRHCESHC